MKVARLAVLGVAIGSGLMAAMIVSNMSSRQPEPQPTEALPVAEVPKIEQSEVLVVNREVPIGNQIKAGDLVWAAWPKSNLIDAYITKERKPDAIKEMDGSIARTALLSGEPVREARFLKSERGFMSVILGPGMRAIAVEVKAVSTAGGFVLPNDRVDVILTRAAPKSGAGGDPYISETILTNIRILAIDQMVQDPRGEGAVVAKDTATLELTPRQAEVVAQAQQLGTISLVLRSIQDANADTPKDDGPAGTNGAVRFVRYGITSRVNPGR